MSSFADFKSKLSNRDVAISAQFGAKSYTDDRFWKLGVPTGKEESTAVIRFLPQKDADKSSFLQYYHFSFKNPATDQFYIENCLNSLGETVSDPCSEENRRLWNMNAPEGQPDKYKDIARNRKRKTSYLCNILVIQDKANPENNGKVFLFRIGKQLLEKINVAAAGNEALGKAPFDPTAFDDGANFAITMQKEDSGYFGYDKSVFGNQTAIPEGIQESVYNQLYDLDTVLVYKSYDELKDRLNQVLGVTTKPVKVDDSQDEGISADALPYTPKEPTPSVLRNKVTVQAPSLGDVDDDEFLNSLLA